MIQWLLLKIYRWVEFHTRPSDESLAAHLVIHTAALELLKGQVRELAPMPGCCGTITVSGNSLPVFEYTVFEKAVREFIKVRVEVSRPGRIQYRAWIDSHAHTDNKRHGEVVEVRQKYKEPFQRLAIALWRYFPLTRSP